MKITQKLLSLGKKARGGVKFAKKLERIIIHWIGPYPNQAVSTPWQWWEKGSDGNGVQASAHFIVKNDDIIQCLPLDEVGWHSGDSRNYNSIGIEVIPKNEQGEFGSITIDALKRLVQHIRDEIGLPLPLERHFDGTQKKDCPRYYTPLSDVGDGQQRWEELKLFLNGGE
jgi:hypothetical protein